MNDSLVHHRATHFFNARKKSTHNEIRLQLLTEQGDKNFRDREAESFNRALNQLLSEIPLHRINHQQQTKLKTLAIFLLTCLGGFNGYTFGLVGWQKGEALGGFPLNLLFGAMAGYCDGMLDAVYAPDCIQTKPSAKFLKSIRENEISDKMSTRFFHWLNDTKTVKTTMSFIPAIVSAVPYAAMTLSVTHSLPISGIRFILKLFVGYAGLDNFYSYLSMPRTNDCQQRQDLLLLLEESKKNVELMSETEAQLCRERLEKTSHQLSIEKSEAAMDLLLSLVFNSETSVDYYQPSKKSTLKNYFDKFLKIASYVLGFLAPEYYICFILESFKTMDMDFDKMGIIATIGTSLLVLLCMLPNWGLWGYSMLNSSDKIHGITIKNFFKNLPTTLVYGFMTYLVTEYCWNNVDTSSVPHRAHPSEEMKWFFMPSTVITLFALYFVAGKEAIKRVYGKIQENTGHGNRQALLASYDILQKAICGMPREAVEFLYDSMDAAVHARDLDVFQRHMRDDNSARVLTNFHVVTAERNAEDQTHLLSRSIDPENQIHYYGSMAK